MRPDVLQVFLGTKAQYVKTAPLLRLLDERSLPYRLIDSGQHAELSRSLRRELEVRDPDVVLGGQGDVSSLPEAVRWAARLARQLPSAARLRDEVFGGRGGICVVHGDTPSTLLSALMARRAGLRVAHLEAGLRSHSLLHPVPEEAIRVVVMRLADLLFAPDDTAVANLAAMRVRGRIVPVGANTSVEALRWTLGGRAPDVAPTGPVLVHSHRVENLHRPARVEGVVALAERAGRDRPVKFVVLGPMAGVLERTGARARLEAAGVELVPTLPHAGFVAALAAAPFVVTDGGSTQEECALLGVPTLLWRARTERPDGLGANVVLSRYDPAVVEAFLADPERHRRPPTALDRTPSADIRAVLLQELGGVPAP